MNLDEAERNNPWRAIIVGFAILAVLVVALMLVGECCETGKAPYPLPPPIRQHKAKTQTVVCPLCGAEYETGD